MLQTSYFAEEEEKDRVHNEGRNSLTAEEGEKVKKLRIVMAPWPGCC